jgi:hypothetical protein
MQRYSGQSTRTDRISIGEESPVITARQYGSAEVRLALAAINGVSPSLAKQYIKLMSFLALNPAFRGKTGALKTLKFGTNDYFIKTAQMFADGRNIAKPKVSGKTMDPLLLELFQALAELPSKKALRAAQHHALFMVTENIVGKLLEHYLASKLEALGWIWCSGDVVNKVDFIRQKPHKEFELLQVKNKDVTENSASAKGRGAVPKWARLKGKRARDNWQQFPDARGRSLLSEADFLAYAMAIQKAW